MNSETFFQATEYQIQTSQLSRDALASLRESSF